MKRLQKSSLFRPLIVVACLAFSLYLSVLPRSVHAQTPPEPVTPTVGPEQVSTESLGALRKTLTEDESLDADTKKLAGEQLDAAAAALKNEQRYQQTLQKLKLDAETDVDERARIEQLLA